MVFPVVIYGSWELDHKEGWVAKNWCFPTVVLKKTPESQLVFKEIKPINPKGNQPWILSLEGLMLKLKLQYFGHLMRRADSLEKTLMLGKTEVKRKGQQRMRRLDGITVTMDTNLNKLREIGRTEEPAAAHGVAKSQTQLGNWAKQKCWLHVFWFSQPRVV